MTHEDAPPPEAPAGFAILGELGRGSSAVVWLARYELTGGTVALKVWRRPLEGELERQRFVNECRWHRELSDHPNIVGWVWASSPDDGLPWIATVPHGSSLKEILEDGPLPIGLALGLSLDLLDGIGAMHRRGLVHRDIKLSNILVDDNRAALCDLGIAMPIEEVTREWRAGTPGYLAPELEREGGQSQPPDYRTDVYSAGVTISKIIGDAAPPAVDHLINAVATSTNRQDRPADGQNFAGRLREAIKVSGFEPRVEPSRREPAPPRSPRKLVAWGVALVVLAAAIITASALSATAGGDAVPEAAETTLASLPDVGPDGSPQMRDIRNAGRCEGNPSDDSTQTFDINGNVGFIVEIKFDERGQACGKLQKTVASGLYQQQTYLALSLCNAQGQCDHDWNRYRVDAGPVKVSAVDGCVVWRASAMDAAEETWILRDVVNAAACE